MPIQWVTTNANPKLPGWTEQHGWKLHAVETGADTLSYKVTFADIRWKPALCGLLPRHGWGLDLFIEAKCERCAAKIALRTAHSAPSGASG